MHLTDEERRILDGAFGEPQRIALSVLVKLGEAYGADRMLEITSAHVVGSSYQIAGEAGIEIYTQLVAAGGQGEGAHDLRPRLHRLRTLARVQDPCGLRRTADQDRRTARPDGRDPNLDVHPLHHLQRAQVRRGPGLVGIQRGGLRQLGHRGAHESPGRLRGRLRRPGRPGAAIRPPRAGVPAGRGPLRAGSRPLREASRITSSRPWAIWSARRRATASPSSSG